LYLKQLVKLVTAVTPFELRNCMYCL